MLIIVSPHLDDAVLSLGQFLAANDDPDLIVATVFAGIPNAGLSEYDQSCGFTSSTQAMMERRAEDLDAMTGFGAQVQYGPFFDQQYRIPNDPDDMREWLAPLFGPEHHTFVPVGVGHPDHRTVARLCRDVAGPEAILYEELPYRVLQPEQTNMARDAWRANGWMIDPLPYPLEQGAHTAKAAAIECYRSQFPDGATDPCVFVPERAWRATR